MINPHPAIRVTPTAMDTIAHTVSIIFSPFFHRTAAMTTDNIPIAKYRLRHTLTTSIFDLDMCFLLLDTFPFSTSCLAFVAAYFVTLIFQTDNINDCTCPLFVAL